MFEVLGAVVLFALLAGQETQASEKVLEDLLGVSRRQAFDRRGVRVRIHLVFAVEIWPDEGSPRTYGSVYGS